MFVLFPLSYLKMVFFTVDFNDKKKQRHVIKKAKAQQKAFGYNRKKEMLYKICSTA